MEKKTGVLAVVVALVLGLGIGHAANGSRFSEYREGSANESHQMADGSMMGGGGGMGMSDTMASMNAALKGKTGDEFDKAFLAEMIVHHQGAVEMAQAALTNAKHQEIKDLAAGIISAQNKEITQMQAWQKSWYNQ